jgi:hypothetical protein
MLLLALRFRRASLNLALRPLALCTPFGTSTTSEFNAAGATKAEKEAYLRGLPATTPLLERVRLWWELLNQPYGNRPTLTRVLLVNAEDEKQRARLPLQSLTHPFFIAPLSETPLLLGLSLFGVLSGTVNYLHQGFMGLAAEPFLLLFLPTPPSTAEPFAAICWRAFCCSSFPR